MKYIPNYITCFRFLLVPLVCYFILHECYCMQLLGLIFFTIAAVSDFVDGYLARRMKCESKFGECFDNIADKVLNISVICSLLALNEIWLVPSIAVIAREITISAIREYSILHGTQIKVNFFGKVKTTFQFIGIFLLLYPVSHDTYVQLIHISGNMIFTISAILSILSGGIYIKRCFFFN